MELFEKVRENRLRRWAQRQGFELSRSRTRDPRALDFGTYTLNDPGHGEPVGNHNSFKRMTLDEVEEYLTVDHYERRDGGLYLVPPDRTAVREARLEEARVLVVPYPPSRTPRGHRVFSVRDNADSTEWFEVVDGPTMVDCNCGGTPHECFHIRTLRSMTDGGQA